MKQGLACINGDKHRLGIDQLNCLAFKQPNRALKGFQFSPLNVQFENINSFNIMLATKYVQGGGRYLYFADILDLLERLDPQDGFFSRREQGVCVACAVAIEVPGALRPANCIWYRRRISEFSNVQS